VNTTRFLKLERFRRVALVNLLPTVLLKSGFFSDLLSTISLVRVSTLFSLLFAVPPFDGTGAELKTLQI